MSPGLGPLITDSHLSHSSLPVPSSAFSQEFSKRDATLLGRFAPHIMTRIRNHHSLAFGKPLSQGSNAPFQYRQSVIAREEQHRSVELFDQFRRRHRERDA